MIKNQTFFHQVEGHLENTGRGIRFNVNFNSSSSLRLRGGPLSYEYQLSHLILHFGRENDRGSEHSINGQRFPGELQAYFFNSILYENYTEAEHQPNGLAALAVLLQISENEEVGNEMNEQTRNRPTKKAAPSLAPSNKASADFRQLLTEMEQIKHKGSRSQGQWHLNLKRLLPAGQFYLTYEGSLTEPPCTETTVWLLLNRPLRLLSRQLHTLRHSVVIDGYGDNYRPSQSLTGRCVRTNIVNRSVLADNSSATEKLFQLAGLSINENSVADADDQVTNNNNNKMLPKNRSTIDVDDETNTIDPTTVKSFCTVGNRIGFYTYKGKLLIIFFDIYFTNKFC